MRSHLSSRSLEKKIIRAFAVIVILYLVLIAFTSYRFNSAHHRSVSDTRSNEHTLNSVYDSNNQNSAEEIDIWSAEDIPISSTSSSDDTSSPIHPNPTPKQPKGEPLPIEPNPSEIAHPGDALDDTLLLDKPSEAHEDPAPAPTPSAPVESKCEQIYGYGLLNSWSETARVFCDPRNPNFVSQLKTTTSTIDEDGIEILSPEEASHVQTLSSLSNELKSSIAGQNTSISSLLTCRVTVIPGLRSSTQPHSICDAHNLMVNFTKMRLAPCPDERAWHFCDETQLTYLRYNSGAFKASCSKTQDYVPIKFTRDHLRDIFNSFEAESNPAPITQEFITFPAQNSSIITIHEPTLFVTRERGEHANLFHALTDFVNAFQVVQTFNLRNITTRVVLLDEHPEGPYDSVWNRLFSPLHPVIRYHDFNSSTFLFKHALFVPPGYSSFLYSYLREALPCADSMRFFDDFADFFRRSFVVQDHQRQQPVIRKSDALRITFVSRRPYSKYVDHTFIGRVIQNEDKLVQILKHIPNVQVQVIDFAQLTWQEQLQIDSETDLLVGAHGAGLIHTVFTPKHSGLLELFPTSKDKWRCYEHLAVWSGKEYASWDNPEPWAVHISETQDSFPVEEVSFTNIANDLVDRIRNARR